MLSRIPMSIMPSLRSFLRPKPTPGWKLRGTPMVFLTIMPKTIAIMMALTGLCFKLRRTVIHSVSWIPIMAIATVRASPGIILVGFCMPNRKFRILESFLFLIFISLDELTFKCLCPGSDQTLLGLDFFTASSLERDKHRIIALFI